MSQFVDGPLQEVFGVEARRRVEFRADLAGGRAVVDDRAAAGARAAPALPPAEPLRAVADVEEDPPDVPPALDPQLLPGLLPRLGVAGRLGVIRVGGGSVPFDVDDLDRPVSVAPEQ